MTWSMLYMKIKYSSSATSSVEMINLLNKLLFLSSPLSDFVDIRVICKRLGDVEWMCCAQGAPTAPNLAKPVLINDNTKKD